jgi:hypothetical protein
MVAERLRDRVARDPVTISGPAGQLSVTISMGVASYAGPTDTPDDLIKRADEAMYQAKRSGRNRVVASRASPPALTPGARPPPGAYFITPASSGGLSHFPAQRELVALCSAARACGRPDRT